MKVWLVIQNQTDSEYDRSVVNVVDNENKAIALCVKYNKEYAQNVILNEQGLLEKVLDYGFYHFYEYKAMDIE